jgi:hypothetical protein
MLFYVVAAIVLWLTYRWLRGLQTIGSYGSRYVFVTGCDSGFGNLLTKKLDGLGFHVFAGCLSEKGMKQLESQTSSNVTSVRLDVTKTESIQSALQVVKSKLPKDTGIFIYIYILPLSLKQALLRKQPFYNRGKHEWGCLHE